MLEMQGPCCCLRGEKVRYAEVKVRKKCPGLKNVAARGCLKRAMERRGDGKGGRLEAGRGVGTVHSFLLGA